jgi:hypothetical protein
LPMSHLRAAVASRAKFEAAIHLPSFISPAVAHAFKSACFFLWFRRTPPLG